MRTSYDPVLPSAQCGGARSALSCGGDEFVGSIFEPNAITSDDDDDGIPSEEFFTGLPIDGG